MTTAKNILLLFTCAITLTLLSCNSKETKGNGKASMIGEWEFVAFSFDSLSSQFREMSAEQRNERIKKMNDSGKGILFDFNKDSSYTVTPGTSANARAVNGKFKSIGKDELSMMPDNQPPSTARIIVLDEKTLKLEDPMQGMTIELKRKQ